ncbi:glycine--tRNA ligase subunit beta [Caulobacter sp. NIBR1757]|uniref:glycine--tRNA ligase subunit beta n=1 Tax=Caulobacter sp. NIBR1757 TaxID=3016000 RepID=UPI0022F057D2|nr:glycine--tRNA ligase subunit beta [Caulobacter sp. NIBR1757]WGM40090.1 Glycine--tRNA ligase beta subunit [Caulobacter sp. NIBR1757]
MPQLLLELFSEEIPARMQAQAARDLERMVRDGLSAAGLISEGMKAFAGPRRLALVIEGLPVAQADRDEEVKGPRVGSPDQAIDGFLRKTGLTREQLTERDGVWFGRIQTAGRPTTEIIAELVEATVRNFPWPKSMTWGSGKLRWVRPLQRILCVFDREIVPISFEGLEAGDLSQGHRFMGSGQVFRARDFDEYREALLGHYVVLDAEERKERILEGARTLCFARNLELVEDEGLLDEVAGLAEWPVPILGDMDPAFLDLPPEVIRTSMRTHQKYFAVRDPATGKLAPHFLVVANIAADDGGKVIAAGNAKVLSARLSDARFFWDEDRKSGFDAWLEKLSGVTFHAKLGTMAERVERIAALAREIAPLVGADPDTAEKAARLAKADLASQMVGEFPELQGVMGRYYANADGLDAVLADAIRDHYRPQGPGDSVPTAPVSIAVALADKLDTLVGFFSIDEKPTGSKDPYALRRAALGVIRIILESGKRLALNTVSGVRANDLMPFFADRLKVTLRDQGKRFDLVDAVFALNDDDLVRIVARVEALDGFLKTDDGANLLAGYRRAANILKAEEKKGALPTGTLVESAGPPEEQALIQAVLALSLKLEPALAAEDYTAAMTALAALRAPVDAFFEKVLVNSDVPEERTNRLLLLQQVQSAMGKVADFSLVAG